MQNPPTTPAQIAQSASQAAPIRSADSRRRIDDYLPMLERFGWKRENVAAITLSPTTQEVVIAAPQPGKRRITDETDLYLVTWDGKIKRLTTDTAGYGFVFFSADEDYLGYLSREGVYTPQEAAEEPPPVPWTVYIQNLRTGVRRAVRRESPSPAGAPPTLFGWMPGTHGLLYSGINPPGLVLFHAGSNLVTPLMLNAPTLILPDWRHAYRIDAVRHTVQFLSVPRNPALMVKPRGWMTAPGYGPFEMPDVPDFTTLGSDNNPVFSPDDSRVALFSAPWGAPLRQLCVIELASGTVHVLGALDSSARKIVWSADGKQLIGRSLHNGHEVRFGISVDHIKPLPLSTIDWAHPTPAIIEAVD